MRIDYPLLSKQRVRYADLDGQAIVFYGNYLTYIDIAINEYLRAMPLDYPGWVAETGLDFNVVKITTEYRSPLRYDDEITVGVRLVRIGRSSITWAVAIFRKDDEVPAATAELIWVCADQKTHQSQPVPDSLRQAFRAVEQHA